MILFMFINMQQHGHPFHYLESALSWEGHPALRTGVGGRGRVNFSLVPSQALLILHDFATDVTLELDAVTLPRVRCHHVLLERLHPKSARTLEKLIE